MSRAAYALLLLLLALASPAPADNAKPLSAILLVARAELPDPNFKGSVVLVMNHIGAAPAGVIVNRPTRVPVSHLFPDIASLAQLDDPVYFGGPVEIETVTFAFRADKPPPNATQVLDNVYMSGNRELLRILLARERPMEGLRIFVGYSGWAPGQLENEIARGDWNLAPADSAAIFDRAPGPVWPEQPARGQRI